MSYTNGQIRQLFDEIYDLNVQNFKLERDKDLLAKFSEYVELFCPETFERASKYANEHKNYLGGSRTV